MNGEGNYMNVVKKQWLFNPAKFMFEYYNEDGIVSDTMNLAEVAKVLKAHVKTQQRRVI